MILVSAIYSNGIDSIIGGRGRNIDFYLSSMKNIANLNFPFVLYTEPENVDKSYNLLSPHFKHLKIIPYELSSFIYYNKFIDWKIKNINFNNYLNDRNEILCYLKCFWVKDTIDNGFFTELNIDQQYMWIDSGLTHHGIFPEKIGGLELLVKHPDTSYYPINKLNIFSPVLADKFKQYVKNINKLFFCSLDWQGDCSRILNCLHKNNLTTNTEYIKEHLIGGIFGGNKYLFLDFFEKYSSLLEIFINEGVHLYEEQIFSALNFIEPELLHREKFDTWWFYSPGEPNSFLSTEQNSFYKIFTKILES
jgi:hypothetical protein